MDSNSPLSDACDVLHSLSKNYTSNLHEVRRSSVELMYLRMINEYNTLLEHLQPSFDPLPASLYSPSSPSMVGAPSPGDNDKARVIVKLSPSVRGTNLVLYLPGVFL